jgi:hypothetical protein
VGKGLHLPLPISRTRELMILKFSEDDLAIVSKLEVKNVLSVSVSSAHIFTHLNLQIAEKKINKIETII